MKIQQSLISQAYWLILVAKIFIFANTIIMGALTGPNSDMSSKFVRYQIARHLRQTINLSNIIRYDLRIDM